MKRMEAWVKLGCPMGNFDAYEASTAAAAAPLPGSSTVRAAEAEAKMQRMMAWVAAGQPGGDFEIYDAANGGKPAATKSVPVSATSTLLSVAGLQQQEEIKRKKEEAEKLKSQLEKERQDALADEEEKKKVVAELQRKLMATTVSDADKKTILNKMRRNIAGIDVVFVMDCTGSMSSWIKECINKITSILDTAGTTLANLIPQGGEINVAFVGYRDYSDGQDREIVHDFVPYSNVAQLKNAISGITAFGGGDAPEDVATALYNCSKLSWGASTKLIIFFGDAPAHGNEYNGGAADSYPGGDPSGHNPSTLMSTFCAKSIDFHFVEINSSTTVMMNKFYEAYDKNKHAASGSGQFFKLQVGDNAAQFLPSVVKAIKDTAMSKMNFEKIKKELGAAGLL